MLSSVNAVKNEDAVLMYDHGVGDKEFLFAER